jgi:ABC-type phosphate transport system substrate-binding protein
MPADARGDAAYQVIVHPNNPTSSIDRDLLARLFLRKITRWPDGRSVFPADLPSSAAVRESFTEQILGRSIAAVRAYWQQAIFSGRDVPPPELPSEQAVVDYVLGNEGAIAYVSRGTNIRNARVLTVK